MALKPCPFCGNTKVKIRYTRGNSPSTGQDGWYADIKCDCPAFMQNWAPKKDWAASHLEFAWNQRAELEGIKVET